MKTLPSHVHIMCCGLKVKQHPIASTLTVTVPQTTQRLTTAGTGGPTNSKGDAYLVCTHACVCAIVRTVQGTVL